MFPDLPRTQLDVTTISSFTGPLPPPEMLEHYDRVMAGLGSTIVQYWIDEQKHRMWRDRINIKLDGAGLFAATLIALVCIVGGFIVITQGAEAEGIAAVLTPIAAIIGAFLYSQSKKEPKPEDRQQEG